MLSEPTDELIFAPFRLDAAVDVLFAGERIVALEPKAVRVLRVLVENARRVVTKEELLETVWADVFTTEDVLKKAVSQVRRALDSESGHQHRIETHHRRGYRFVSGLPETRNAAVELVDSTRDSSSDPNFNLFVGRESELEILRAEFRRTKNGAGQPLIVTGEPGIGKTQLAAQFERWATIAEKAICARARFFDYDAARLSSFAVFFDLLKETLCKIAGENASNLRDGKAQIDFYQQLAKRCDVDLPVDFFQNANAQFELQSDIFRVIEPLANCFVAVSKRAPLVLIFDDLQWADDASRKLVGYLMRVAVGEKLQILALARRAETVDSNHEFARWLRAQAVYRSFTTVDLLPLSIDDFKILIAKVFGRRLDAAAIPNRDFAALHRTTEGNPYFLIEILRLLIRENLIEKVADATAGWRWVWRDLRDVPLPETVRLAARHKLSGLNRTTKDLIERAAVIGDAFQVETLVAMFDGEQSEGETENCLSQAIGAEVLTERGVAGADDLQFYHTILRRAVYADLSPRRRKRLHAHAARAIETVYANDLERVQAPLSAHFEAAENWRAAFERALDACVHASRRFDWADAAELVARAVRATEKCNAAEETRISDESNLRLLLARGEIVMSTGRRSEADETLTKAARLAEKLGDAQSLAHALIVQGQTRILAGRYNEALEVLNRGLPLAAQLNNHDLTAHALAQIASAQYSLGDFAAALGNLQKVVDGAESSWYRKAVALGKIGWVRGLQSDFLGGKQCLERAAGFHRTAGDVRQRIVLQMCLNWCEYGLGNYEAAVKHAEIAEQAARNLGEPYSVHVAQMRIAKARLAQGCLDESEAILNRVLNQIKETGGVHCEAETIWFLGRARLRANDFEQARRLLGDALGKIRKIGDREDEFRILIDQADLHLRLGDTDESLRFAAQAAAIAEELKIPDGLGAASVAQARALLANNEIELARRAAESARDLLDSVYSGERWTTHFALAEIESERDAQNALPHLRETVRLLEQIKSQFSNKDCERRSLFVRAYQEPAQKLHKLFATLNRQAEAAPLARDWNLE